MLVVVAYIQVYILHVGVCRPKLLTLMDRCHMPSADWHLTGLCTKHCQDELYSSSQTSYGETASTVALLSSGTSGLVDTWMRNQLLQEGVVGGASRGHSSLWSDQTQQHLHENTNTQMLCTIPSPSAAEHVHKASLNPLHSAPKCSNPKYRPCLKNLPSTLHYPPNARRRVQQLTRWELYLCHTQAKPFVSYSRKDILKYNWTWLLFCSIP